MFVNIVSAIMVLMKGCSLWQLQLIRPEPELFGEIIEEQFVIDPDRDPGQSVPVHPQDK